MYIYKIINTLTNDFYIGQTRKVVSARFSQHIRTAKNGENTHLYNAMRKYGYDVFIVEEMEKVNTLEELNDRERYWIAQLSPAYNISRGGQGISDYIYTPEHKKNISNSLKGKSHTEETKKKISEANKNRPFPFKGISLPEEHKKKIKESNIGQERPWLYGPHSEETKRKISLAHQGLRPSKESTVKMSAWQKGRKLPKETIDKIRASTIGKRRVYREDGSYYYDYPKDKNQND